MIRMDIRVSDHIYYEEEETMKKNNSIASLILLLFAASVFAGHDKDPRTRNLHPMGHIEEEASLFAGTSRTCPYGR